MHPLGTDKFNADISDSNSLCFKKGIFFMPMFLFYFLEKKDSCHFACSSFRSLRASLMRHLLLWKSKNKITSITFVDHCNVSFFVCYAIWMTDQNQLHESINFFLNRLE